MSKLKGVVGTAIGIAALAAGCSQAQAALLQPGVYLLTQDLGYAGGDTLWNGSTYAPVDDYGGGPNSRADYLTGKTVIRRGFDYGLMGELNVSYQWGSLPTAQYPFGPGALRGGAEYLRLGVYKSIMGISPKTEASFFPGSSLGDLDFFFGGFIPLRKPDLFNFFTRFESTFKMDFGLRHVYYGSLINPETAVGFTYRGGLPSQGFAMLGLTFHWEACPIAWFRYSYLKPYLQYLTTFGGYESSVAPEFLAEWTANGFAPIQKTDVELLAPGIEFMHPFSYEFFAAIHYSRPVYARNMLQFHEMGITLNYLF